jgi:hypothetical protein
LGLGRSESETHVDQVEGEARRGAKEVLPEIAVKVVEVGSHGVGEDGDVGEIFFSLGFGRMILGSTVPVASALAIRRGLRCV